MHALNGHNMTEWWECEILRFTCNSLIPLYPQIDMQFASTPRPSDLSKNLLRLCF